MSLFRRHVTVRAIFSVASAARCRGVERQKRRSRFLSWGSSKIAPPPMKTMRVHSREIRRPPFGTETPISALVPPLPFHPAPTVSSAHDPAGLLHPATGHGVRHISGSALPGRPKAPGWLRTIPNGAAPFEAFPFATAAPRHRGRCPLAVAPAFRPPSVRASTAVWRVSSVHSTSGLCSIAKSVASSSVAAGFCSVLPWAWVHRKRMRCPARQPRRTAPPWRLAPDRGPVWCAAGSALSVPRSPLPEGRAARGPLSAPALRRARSLLAAARSVARQARGPGGVRFEAPVRAPRPLVPEGAALLGLLAGAPALRGEQAGQEPTAISVIQSSGPVLRSAEKPRCPGKPGGCGPLAPRGA